MPSQLHEILIEMFRDRPVLAAELLGDRLNATLPAFDEAQLSSAELNDVVPTEYRADAVVTLKARARLPAAARECLEELMTVTGYRYQSEFALRYVREGEAVGEARGVAIGEANAVLAILDTRGVTIPDDTRAAIAGCTDLDQLGTWIRRAVTADKIEDLDISTVVR